MPRIIPIKELKDTAKISTLCHETTEPVYITKNGYGDMVLMSIEAYEELYRKDRIYRELEISEHQIREGRTRKPDEVLADMRKKYGLQAGNSGKN